MKIGFRLAAGCLLGLLVLLGGHFIAPTAVTAADDLPGEGVIDATTSPSPAKDRSPKTEKEAEPGADNGLALIPVAVVALGMGGAGGFLIGRTRRSGNKDRSPKASEGLPRTAPVARQTRAVHDAGDRSVDKLVDALIATFDVATTDAQRSRILTALRDVSVTLIQPRAGDAFDPSRHQALGTEATADRGQAGSVVKIERPGWQRGNEIIRFAEVIVGE